MSAFCILEVHGHVHVWDLETLVWQNDFWKQYRLRLKAPMCGMFHLWMHDLMANKKNVQKEGQATCEHSQIGARKKASQVERQIRFWERKRQWLKEEREVVNVLILGEDYLQVVNLERSTTKASKRIVGELTRSQVTGWNPLEGSTKSSCGKLRLGSTLSTSNSRKG